MLRRFSINGNIVNDPANWPDFNFNTGRDATYFGVFKTFPDVKLRWFGQGKEALEADYNQYGSPWRNTTLLVERSTDAGITYTTEANFIVDFKNASLDFEGEAEYIEIGIKQVSALEKFQARDGNEVNVQSLTDKDGGTITVFTNETFDVTLDTQIIDKVDEFEFNGTLGSGGPSAITIQRPAGTDTMAYNLPWDTRAQTQIEDAFLYPPSGISWTFAANLTFPITNGNIFENVRLNVPNETYTQIQITTSGTCQVGFAMGVDTTNIGFELVYVAELYESETNSTASITSTQTLSFTNPSTNIFHVDLSANGTLNAPVVAPFVYTRFDRLHTYLKTTTPVPSLGGNGSGHFFRDVVPTLQYTFASRFPDTTCKVMLIHDFIKRMFQSMTGLAEPIRSDYYGNTNATYPSGGTPTAYSSDGDGALRGVTNVFQIREFPIADKPMVSTFRDFFKFIWGVDACAVGLEFDGATPYFRIEPIEYFYDKTAQILDFSADGRRPKQRQLNVNPSLSYNRIKFGDTNYKDEEFGLLDTINAIREWSIFVESGNTKTYDITIPQITSGTLIELLRRRPFADFEKEDTTYDDDIAIIELRRTGGSSFDRDKDQDFTSITGIDNSSTVYNLKLTPKRRLLRHLKVLSAHLWGVIENPADYGNPELIFEDGKGNNGYSTQLTGETSAVVENANITINSDIEPLFTDEIIEFELPADLSERDTILTTNRGFYQVTSRGEVTKVFIDVANIESEATGMVRFTGKKLYEPPTP